MKFPERRILVPMLVLLAVLIGVLVGLRWLGSQHRWRFLDPTEASTVGESIDFAALSEDGEWLMWTDSSQGRVSVVRIAQPGGILTLQSSSHLSLRPVTVHNQQLLLLRTDWEPGWFRSITAGFDRLFGENSPPPPPPGGGNSEGVLVSYLEAIDLEEQHLDFRLKGTVRKAMAMDPAPGGFEQGRVSLSPDGGKLAWWRAEEMVLDTPLSATVTETIEIFDLKGTPRRLHQRRIESPGYFQTWSGILQSIGRQLWVGPDSCFFLSFAHGGSLVPLHLGNGEFAALITLEDLFLHPETGEPLVPGAPEGVTALHGNDRWEDLFLFWTRQGGSLGMARFDCDFGVVSTVVHDAGNLDFNAPLWLPSGDLLLRERSTGDYMALSQEQGVRARYPASPFAADSFQVLGCDSAGALIGRRDSTFWSAAPGARNWMEIPLSR